MDDANKLRLMDILVENINRILSAGFGLNEVEAAMFEIVELLRTNPQLKEDALAHIKRSFAEPDLGSLSGSLFPPELIHLIGHELRWPELLLLARDRISVRFSGDAQLAVGDISTTLSDAYNDKWLDREFYRRYKFE